MKLAKDRISVRIFNIYSATTAKTEKHSGEDESVSQEPAPKLPSHKGRLRPIDYRAFNSLDPFSFKEDEKELDPLKTLEELQKCLPAYYTLTKKQVERHTLEDKYEASHEPR